MVRKMTLAGVLALLPATACTQEADEAALEAKAEQVKKAAQDIVEKDETLDTVEEAMANAEYGPVIGEPLSVSSLLTSEGQPVELSDLVGDGGGVVIFSRSAEWCPYCQKQMIELNDAVSDIEALGMKLTVITYDEVKTLSQFKAKNGLDFELVSDTESTTIIAANLLNSDIPQNTRYYGVPHPAAVILAADGEVRNVRVDTDYKIRPSNADVLAMAADVNGG